MICHRVLESAYELRKSGRPACRSRPKVSFSSVH